MEDQSNQSASFSIHVAPESTEVWIGPPQTPAASLVPSPEEATHHQPFGGALVIIHVAPKSAEVEIGPGFP